MLDDRNSFADDHWVLRKITDQSLCNSFDCGDSDLNEYFQKDAILNRKELLGQSYYLHEKANPHYCVGLLDFCNDTVRIESYAKAIEQYKDLIPIDERKRHNSLPAVKLTRFGIRKQYQRLGLGSHVLNMVKRFFITENRTGCRFITRDAYNIPGVTSFYEKNEFHFLTDKDKTRKTRAMFFDLKRLILS